MALSGVAARGRNRRSGWQRAAGAAAQPAPA